MTAEADSSRNQAHLIFLGGSECKKSHALLVRRSHVLQE